MTLKLHFSLLLMTTSIIASDQIEPAHVNVKALAAKIQTPTQGIDPRVLGLHKRAATTAAQTSPHIASVASRPAPQSIPAVPKNTSHIIIPDETDDSLTSSGGLFYVDTEETTQDIKTITVKSVHISDLTKKTSNAEEDKERAYTFNPTDS